MPDFITDNPIILISFCIFNFILILFLFISVIANKNRIKKLRDKYNRFMRGATGENIDYMIEGLLNKVDDLNRKNSDIENHINSLERNFLLCIQKVGVVRYNAFDDVGSDLSFSIALLDNNDNGLVFSGLYSRDSSSTYAKPVMSGKSKYALSVEELKAINVAQKMHRDIFDAGEH